VECQYPHEHKVNHSYPHHSPCRFWHCAPLSATSQAPEATECYLGSPSASCSSNLIVKRNRCCQRKFRVETHLRSRGRRCWETEVRKRTVLGMFWGKGGEVLGVFYCYSHLTLRGSNQLILKNPQIRMYHARILSSRDVVIL
jgi:hypothetical protein